MNGLLGCMCMPGAHSGQKRASYLLKQVTAFVSPISTLLAICVLETKPPLSTTAVGAFNPCTGSTASI